MAEPDEVDLVQVATAVERLVTRMDTYLDNQQTSAQTTTVIHRTAGVGPWAAAAITACFFTAIMLVGFAMIVLPELHDHKAWIDLYRGQISKNQAAIEQLKEVTTSKK